MLVTLFSTKSTSKFNVITNLLFSSFFYLILVSIPTCSFNKKLMFLTWIFAALLLFTMIVKILVAGRLVCNVTLLVSYILLVASMLLSSLLNWNGAFTLTPYILTGVAFVSFLFFSSFEELRQWSFLLVFASMVSFLLIFIVLYYKELIARDFYRLGTAFGDQNEVAMFMALGACFTVYFFMFRSGAIRKILLGILFLTFVYCGFSTGSKLFILTLAGCVTFLIFAYFNKRWWLSILVLCAIAIVGVVVLALPAFASYRDRILGFLKFFLPGANGLTDFSTYERYEMFIGALHMFSTKPIFGFGTLGFAQFSSFGRGCHNTYGQMLCNYGLIGFLLFFFPFALSFYLYGKAQKNGREKLSVMMVLFFVLCAFSLYLDIQKIYAFTIPLAYAELTKHGGRWNYNFSFRNFFDWYYLKCFCKRKTRNIYFINE